VQLCLASTCLNVQLVPCAGTPSQAASEYPLVNKICTCGYRSASFAAAATSPSFGMTRSMNRQRRLFMLT